MVRRSRTLLSAAVCCAALLAMVPAGSALSPLDVLIVNDGHTLKPFNETEFKNRYPDRFVSEYRQSLDFVENTNIDVVDVGALEHGPNASFMARYDIVIWYTLWDNEEAVKEQCPKGNQELNGQEACRTFFGNPDKLSDGGGDIQNISDYLIDRRGRMMVTGHKVGYEIHGSDFYNFLLGAWRGSDIIHECNDVTDNCGTTDFSPADVDATAIGEDGDPVTDDSFFDITINTTQEPKAERDIFVDYCVDEHPFSDGHDTFCDSIWSQDMLRWDHSALQQIWGFEWSTRDGEEIDDYAHSMSRTNRSYEKTVYAGFGLESIESTRARKRLMNWTVNYLAGPRVLGTSVSDHDDIAGTAADESRFVNTTADIRATCRNLQLSNGIHIADAQFFHSAMSGGIPDNPRKAGGDGLTMSAVSSGYGDERLEEVERQDWDAANAVNPSADEGKNATVGVHCEDTGPSQYWGQFERRWVVVDTNPPEPPEDVRFTSSYTNDPAVNITVDNRVFEPARADLVRFSCDQSDWTEWKVYDPDPALGSGAPIERNFTVNLTDSTMGCASTDGNKTVHAQVMDYAGNKPGSIVSDFIVLDRVQPTFRTIDPANTTFIRETTNITVNATDDRAGIAIGVHAPNNTFNTGGTNQTFVVNRSFDPGYTSNGTKPLHTFIFDRASNVITDFFEFTVDLLPPNVDGISPSNDSAIRSTDDITIDVSDATSRVQRFAVYNGTHWDNQSVDAGSATRTVDPGWTSEGFHVLTVRINDSVDRITRERYHYEVDDTPPAFLGFDPGNGSYIAGDGRITIDIVDRFAAGIDVNKFQTHRIGNSDLYNVTFAANHSFDPDWSQEGLHNATVFTNDTLDHRNRTFLQYTLDETAPSIGSITPTGNYINSSGNITVPASDNLAGVGVSIYSNGTHNASFTPGISFDPGWTTETLQTLDVWVNDTVGNMRTAEKQWELDDTPPSFDASTPANTTYITGRDDISIDVSDGGAGVSVMVAYNGSRNLSIDDETAFDPGWTTSVTHDLRVWVNDTVRNMRRTTYRFPLDDLPPSLKQARPGNASHITSDDDVTLKVVDRGAEGGIGVDVIRAYNGSHNLTVASGEAFDPGWGEGVHDLIVYKNDTLGNANSTTLRYTVDDTPPSTTDNHTFSGWRATNKTVGLDTTDNFGADLVSSCVYPMDAAACSPTVTGTPNVTVSVGCVPGDTCNRTVRYRANDTAGNVEQAQESASIAIDKEAPAVDFVTPVAGQTVSGTIDIQALVNDEGAGTNAASVQYSIVNRTGGTLGAVIQTGTLNDTLDTTTITSTTGSAVFNVSAADDVGNMVNSTNITFSIDNRAIVTNIEKQSETFVNGDFPLDLRASRLDRGVGNMSYNITNTTSILNETVRAPAGGIDLPKDNFTFTVNVDGTWTDGNLSLMFDAYDNQTSPTYSLSASWFVLDRNRPSVDIDLRNTSWVSGTLSVPYDAANGTDPWSMKRCRYRYRDNASVAWSRNFSTDCGTGESFEFDTTNCQDDADATCTIQLFGRDQAGNVNSSTVYLRVDNSEPSVSIDTPHAWHNGDFEVSHTEDDPQGFWNRSYRINRTTWRPLGDANITVDIQSRCSVEGSRTCRVTVNATNNVNDTVTASRNYSIDTSPPGIVSVTPGNNSNLTSADDIRVDFEASVAGKRRSVFNNGTGNHTFQDATDFDPGWTSEGAHPLDIWVIDRAGNVLREHYAYTVDNTAPVFVSVTPGNATNITPADTLAVDIDDAVTGVERSVFDKGDGINRSFNDGDAFDPQWETDGYHWIDFYLADFADNRNHTARRYFVDGTAPVIVLDAPSNGSVIRSDRNITVNATDAGVGVDKASFVNVDTGSTIFFTPNESFDPGWTTQGRHRFTPTVNDTLDNTRSRNYYFTVDGTPPNIMSVETNRSIVAPSSAFEIRANVSENYSAIGLVRGETTAGGSTVEENTLTPVAGTDSHNATFTAPAGSSQTLSVNVSANDTLRHHRFNTSRTVLVDARPPNVTRTGFNVSSDPVFGETRIYRDTAIQIRANLSDNGAIAHAVVTVNTSSNPSSGENLTLDLDEGTNREGVWTVPYTDTDHVGTYNLTTLYLNDSVANQNVTTRLPVFTVVNHSTVAALGGVDTVEAGRTVPLNVSVSFNRSLTDAGVRIFVPPSVPSSLAAPVFTNTTPYDCTTNAGSCSLAFDRVNGTVAAVNASLTGTGTVLHVSGIVRAETPATDTNRTWRSRVQGHVQPAVTTITAPLLNISTVYCGDNTNCTVDQRKAFPMNITVENIDDADHSGLANDTVVNVTHDTQPIEKTAVVGDISSGSTVNATFTLNISDAGTFDLSTGTFENLTRTYDDQDAVTVTVRDTLPPNASEETVSPQLVNPGEGAMVSLTARDNVGVTAVNATILNASDAVENVSLSLSSGDATLGSWRARYSATQEVGRYNVTDIYLHDDAGNVRSVEPSLSFRTTQLALNVSVNTTGVGIKHPVRINANVSGNTTEVTRIVANITKPRGFLTNLTLTYREDPAVHGFTTVLQNTSRSGAYAVNVTVSAGSRTWNDSQRFSVQFGSPTVSPLDGNGTHIVLPQTASPYNLSWNVEAPSGDLEDVNTSVAIADTSVLTRGSGQTNSSFIGNVTYERGSKPATFNFSAEASGLVSITFVANTTRNRSAINTVTANVTTIATAPPNITGFTDTPDVVNKRQQVRIHANISSPSIVENATIVVHHPDTGSNATEPPRVMQRTDRGRYRHTFTNTNETGRYTYEITVWDVTGGTDRIVSNSFNVSEAYTVNVSTEKGLYRKGEGATISVTVRDVNGDRVPRANLTLVLDRHGSNTTLLPDNRTREETYNIKRNDPPSSSLSPSSLPIAYTVHANVSNRGNTGRRQHQFGVTRLMVRDLEMLFENLEQGDTVAPGEEFQVRLDLDYRSGGPVKGAIVFVRCNTCPSDFKFLEVSTDSDERGIYVRNFTAPTDSDSLALRAFASDGSGNGLSQDGQAAPFISLDVGTGGTGGQTDGQTGGGGGGGAAGPTLEIDRRSPVSELPPNRSSVNLSVTTNLAATCRYTQDEASFSEATPFNSTGGTTHFTTFPVVPGTSYNLRIICSTPEDLTGEQPIAFSVRQREVATYTVEMPGGTINIPQGTNQTAQVTLFNNGTERLRIDLSSEGACCTTFFRRLTGQRTDRISLAPGTGDVIELVIDVPLNVSVGRHSIVTRYMRENRTLPRSITVQVTKSQYITRYEELRDRAQQIQQRIQEYRRAGIDTSNLEDQFDQLNRLLRFADTAIDTDQRRELQKTISDAEQRANAIRQQLDVLAFRQYVLENWWKWLIGAGIVYVLFFLITMVAIPYYRLRTQYLNTQQRLDSAVEARRKAEKQYFRREIDRDTFMNIMTERQDEILELRGETEELEDELETAVRDRITVENIVKAPIKAFREIAMWWNARHTEESEG